MASNFRKAANKIRENLRDRKMLLRKIEERAKDLRRSLLIGGENTRFIEHNRNAWAGWKVSKKRAEILVDFYSISQTIIAYSYFLNVLAKKHDAGIVAFSLKNPVLNRCLKKIYQSFNTEHVLVPKLNLEQEKRKIRICENLRKNIKTKRDVFDIRVMGIWIGIDIYETYLRSYSKPTVDVNDERLYDVIDKAVELFVFWKDYLEKKSVAAVVVSHDVYIQFNVLCKLAYDKKIPVYLPNIRGITYAQKPFSVYEYFPRYREMFNRLSDLEKKEGLAFGKQVLERKLSGEVGVYMAYSTKSAFSPLKSNVRVLKESDKIKVLICTHCFFDNPHGYAQMPFLDFCEWLQHLGKISKHTDYDWYVKMHPDPLPGTEKVVREIFGDFPHISFIPGDTSHHQLVKEGLDYAVTVHGSIGHEYPALGVQVISAGYNPRVAYDIDWNPKTIDEYEHCLLNLHQLKKDVRWDDLYEFYYMHHGYVCADDLYLNSYWRFLEEVKPDDRGGPKAYAYFLDQLSETEHKQIIANIEGFLNSGKQHYFKRGPE